MKPDGVTMETTEPTEAAAVAEPSNPSDNSSDQASGPTEQPITAGPPSTAVNGASVNGTTTGAKPKSATAPTKKQPSSKTESRPGVTSRRPGNDVRPTNSATSRMASVSKPLASSAKPPGAVPKRPLGGASGSTTTKTQVKMSEKKPSGPSSAMTNGTKPANTTPKKTLPPTKPKTTGLLSRPVGPTAPKPSAPPLAKPDSAAPTKSSRPATAPTSRPAAKASTAAATSKASSMAKTSASSAATAPSSGRTSAAQHNKATAPAKKDVSRPGLSAAAVARNTTTAATKKPEASKSTVHVKSTTASAKVDVKPPPKPQQAIKPNATKKPAAVAARFPAVNRVGQTPPGSPIHKSQSSGNTARSKQAQKPTQTVPRFTSAKRTEKMGAAKPEAAHSNKAESPSKGDVSAAAALVAATAAVQKTQVEAVVPLPQELKPETTEPVKESASAAAQSTSLEMVHNESESNTVLVPQCPIRSPSPQIERQQLDALANDESASGEPSTSSVAFASQPEDLVIEAHISHPPKPTAASENDSPQVIPPNLNEDDEEEEKEGSQLVSVSEMSGTTQPTEDSRPGSAGPVGASAWRVGGALLSELDSEEVSVSQQGASELSAPGVLEGTESMDDLGEGSLKGAMDMEGASAGSPDFEKVPEIPVNDYDEDDEDDNDRVCDMDVGSERTDEPQRLRHDNDVDDEEDEDVEMASEGVTESGLESYGNADEDDFAEDERLDNLNRVVQPPPPPLLPSAPAAQWEQPNHFIDPWAQPAPPQIPSEPDSQSGQGAEVVTESPLTDPCQGDSETPTQEPAQTWLELGSATFTNENQDVAQLSPSKKDENTADPQMYQEQTSSAASEPHQSLSPPCAPVPSPLSLVSSDTATDDDYNHGHREKDALPPQPEFAQRGEPEGAPVIEVLDSAQAPASNPSSSSVTEDEASDMEGEAQLEDSLETPAVCNVTFDLQPHGQRALSTVEEGEEPEDSGAAEDATPPSANSQVSSGFDTTTSASNAQSTGESCVKSPGIFSLEELPEEAKEPPAPPSVPEQPYIVCVKQVDSEQSIDHKLVNADNVFSPSPEPQQLEQMHPLDDTQPPYYSAICEKTENSFAGFSALLHPQRRDHSSFPRTYCDIVKPVNAALASPKLSCADLPPRSPKQQPLSPQLRRLEQHQRHLLELQQRREQQNRPLEEAEQERKRREEEEERKKKDEAEEEIKRNKEEVERRLLEEEAKRQESEQRKALELQLQQQQEELKQRQQILQWQQELQESNKEQPLLLSPSSGLCTIYEALENSEDEDGANKYEEHFVKDLNSVSEMSSEMCQEVDSACGRVTPKPQSTQNSQDVPQTLTPPSQNGDFPSTTHKSPEKPSPLDLDWGKKVDIVHQLINQTLLLNGDGCSSLLLLPGGAGTLSPLESSLWPSLLPPLTPPSATVTSVSSFSPETSGSSPQGEWTVVELETHH